MYLGQESGGPWDALLFPNGAFILRPIRILETAPYFFPDDDYLHRKYGRDSIGRRIKHFMQAVGQFARFGWDSLYFAWERFWRLKRIGFSTSISNRLNVETFFSKRIRKS